MSTLSSKGNSGVLALPLNGCETLGKLLNLSVPLLWSLRQGYLCHRVVARITLIYVEHSGLYLAQWEYCVYGNDYDYFAKRKQGGGVWRDRKNQRPGFLDGLLLGGFWVAELCCDYYRSQEPGASCPAQVLFRGQKRSGQSRERFGSCVYGFDLPVFHF